MGGGVRVAGGGVGRKLKAGVVGGENGSRQKKEKLRVGVGM